MRCSVLRLLAVLALILSSTAAWAGGVKIGQVSITGQTPNPVDRTKSATFFLTLTRNNQNGSTGAFVVNLTYQLPAGVTAAPSTPTSISFTSKESSKGVFITLVVGATVQPGVYPFTVTATRSGSANDIVIGQAVLVVSSKQVGPIAVNDSGYYTSGLPITIPVLANDIPDPSIPTQPLTVTAIQGVAVKAGGTVNLTNASVTLNADGTLTYTPVTNLVPGADQFTYTITDINNNSSSALVTVTVGQYPRVTVAPHLIVACSFPITLTATAASGFPPYTYTWTDSTNTVIRTSSATSGSDSLSVSATGSYSVIVTDSTGNASAPDNSMVVSDTTPPTITTCPAAQTASAGAGCQAAVPDFTAGVVASDNCTPSASLLITQSPKAGTLVGPGSTPITLTVTDAANNSSTCTTSFTVADTTPPTLSNCPPPNLGTISANGSCQAAVPNVLTGVTATDNCTPSGSITMSQSPAAGTLVGLGPHTITITATDAAGNPSSCTTSFTVADTTPPTITGCPQNLTVYTGPGRSTCDQVATWTAPTASDNCAGVRLTSNHNPGDTFPVGTTTVTYTATDAAGNTSTCSFTVTVVGNTPPTITCPGDVTVNTDAGQCTASNVPLGSPTTSDNCGSVTVTNNAPAIFPKGTTTVTWTATDAAGNTATCTQKVTVVDNQDPTITCPPAVTVNTDPGQCTATVSDATLGSATAGDNCPGVTVTRSGVPSGNIFPKGTTTITYTATDAAGRTASCTQTVTVLDKEPPRITCPAAVTASTDPGKCSASGVSLGSPTTADNCGVAAVSNDAPATFPKGTTTVTWTVTDTSGNSTTCTQTVTVVDNQPPSITCPAPVSVNADAGQCYATNVALGTPTTSDNCGVKSVSGSRGDKKALTDPYPVGTTTITWTVTDVNGNTSTCTQTVTVTDNQAATMNCPADVKVSADAGQCYATNVNLGTPTTSDNCGIGGATNNAPTQFPVGTTTVTWTVTDVNGNSRTCQQKVTVVDDQPPTIKCLAPVSVNTDAGQCYASNVNLGTPTTSDNCGVKSVSSDAPAHFPVGTTTVTWTVTDVNGNTNTCTQLVTVTDNQLPTITCPAPVSVNTDPGKCTASSVALGTPTTADNCGVATVTNDAPAQFPKGDTIVTWTVTDTSGNTATCRQKVSVKDTQLPTISAPADVTVSTDAGACSASQVGLGTPTTGDNCGVASVSNDAPAIFPKGTTTVTWTVTDTSGNTATATQKVTVTDTEKPTITCPAAVTVSTDPGKSTTSNVGLGTPTVHDNCAVASVSNNAPATFPVGTTPVTWTVTDTSGNTATCTQSVTVLDKEPPTITCPAAVTANTDPGKCSASTVSLGTPTTADNVGVASVTNNAPAVFPKGTTTVTWTVTDTSGNTATCTQLVTVQDSEKPTITCPPGVTANTDPGQCYASNVNLGTPTTSDNCGVASVSSDAPAHFPVGTTSVTWTVTDVNGNINTCTQLVTVTDNQLPTITCPAAVSVSTDPGQCYASNVKLGTPATADNCGVKSVTNDAPAQFPKGDTIVTWTVTDTSGNTATCQQKVSVKDTQLPTISAPADVTVSTDAGACSASKVALGTPKTGDNCGVASVTNNAPAIFPKGTTTVTWTVTDTSGNTATATQKVTVNDTEKPAITCPPNVTVSPDPGQSTASNVSLGTPTVTDNCGVAGVSNNAPATFPAGTTTVTWTVTDTSGNTATCTQLVTVTDAACDTLSAITSNFNGIAIQAGRTIWFRSVLKATGLGSTPVTITVQDAQIQFAGYTVPVPNARLTFNPGSTTAATSFDYTTNSWVTVAPSSGLSGNTFLAGVTFPVPVNLPGGISPVIWSGRFITDTPGVTIQWEWTATVYAQFSLDYNALGVKPVDDSTASVYKNSDAAGTPENFKGFVMGGARGGGGFSYTGSYSGTASVACMP